MSPEDPRGGDSTLPPEDVGSEPGRAYLLVLERGSSRLYPLPIMGTVVVGRSGADLSLDDRSVSRRHAQLVIGLDGAARVVDLGSQNGTLVNGERIDGEQALFPGDSIGIAGATLVYQATRPRPAVALLEPAALRARAAEEVDRALRFGRPLSLVALAGRGLDGVLGQVARPLVAGRDGGERLVALFPEMDGEGIAAAAEELLERARAVDPAARAGFATCPADGCDASTLIAAARAALRGADQRAEAAATSYETRRIGDKVVVVADPAMARLYDLVERLAATDLPVLVTGETGAGKELVARALHALSPRRDGRYVAVNCAALTESLAESELFGHVRGAFSGASEHKRGLVETAGGGTLFLDEVGELPLGLQAKLLRVLETRAVMRVGGVDEIPVDLRVVAATNREPQREVAAGRFRSDLYFRLGGATVCVPPLRDRKREIAVLARLFLAEARARAGRPAPRLADAAMHALLQHAWPGNVRQLKNLMELLAATVSGDEIDAEHLGIEPGEEAPPSAGARQPLPPAFRPLEEEMRALERERIAAALAATGGNQTRAAALIGMPVRTFFAKVKQHGLKPRG